MYLRFPCPLVLMLLLVGCQDQKPVNAPNPAEAPCVRGKITIVGPWQDEPLVAGFAGKGKDGKTYLNTCGLTFMSLGSGEAITSETFRPQLSTLFNHATYGLGFKHVKMAPGDHIVFVRRDGVPAAWKKVTLNEGDQLSADLTIDPAQLGSIVVTLPDEEANAAMSLIDSSLMLIPIEFDRSEKWVRPAFETGYVERGNKTVARKGVPPGKYRAVRGKSEADLEVSAGKEAAITLVRSVEKK